MKKIMAVIFTLVFSVTVQAEAGTYLWRGALVATGVTMYTLNPFNTTRTSIELGSAGDVTQSKLTLRWDWRNDLYQWDNWTAKAFVQFDLAKWQDTDISGEEGSVNVIGLAPVYRIERNKNFSISDYELIDYIEYHVGGAFLSRNELDERDFSIHFQFSDTLSIGWFLNESRSWDLQLTYQHYSNNGIELPNNGINFVQLGVGHNF
jgi:hypothetical protein